MFNDSLIEVETLTEAETETLVLADSLSKTEALVLCDSETDVETD